MGSRSDLEVMREALDTMKEFGVEHELTVVSAHRTPDRMFAYAKGAADRGIKVIIAGAGGAAHLPGMVASLTILPVIGVPIKSRNSIDGWDSLLSIVQMPSGVPAGMDHWIQQGTDWTWGCIALRNADLDEIFPLIQLQRTRLDIVP